VTTLALAVAPRTGVSRRAYQVVLVVGGSLFMAGLAQISIKLPFTPVPISGQTLGALLIGASLGPALGGLSLLLYIVEGWIGLPFFASGEHAGPAVFFTPKAAFASAGYLWGFVLAAGAVGWLARRGWDRSLRSAISAFFLGEVVLYAVGIPWLMSALDVPLEKALELGLYPFVIGDTLKLLLAAGLLPTAWRLVGGSKSSR
jgi:biotin transport system substrate-specific component